jgi:hypothetical protein
MIAEEVGDLWEPWMRHADRVLEDEALLAMTQAELSKRIPKSKTRGRPGTTAEVVLRMLLLKHVRGFTFEELTREVRSSLVYRAFTRVGAGKVPDEKTMGRLAMQTRPQLPRGIQRASLQHSLPPGGKELGSPGHELVGRGIRRGKPDLRSRQIRPAAWIHHRSPPACRDNRANRTCGSCHVGLGQCTNDLRLKGST